MDLTEGVGESSSPPRSFTSFTYYDVRNEVYNRLNEAGHVLNPAFREQLDAHFNRLPASYGVDVNLDKPEDVLLHQKLLAKAKDPAKRPVFHIRYLENATTDGDYDAQSPYTAIPQPASNVDNPTKDCTVEFEPSSKFGDLNLNVRMDAEGGRLSKNLCARQDISLVPIHEIIFSTIDKPKLLSQLSAVLSDIGLNIREAHVFSTTDGFSLDVFVVDGWPVEDTDGLYKALREAIVKSEGSWSGSTLCPAANKGQAGQGKYADWEIDRRLLKIGEKVASGSCGDLHHGTYLGQDVAVKVLRSDNSTTAQADEFVQEAVILREVHHRNVVRFIGACTKFPHMCIVTEYMPRGSLYDYLHSNHDVLNLSQLLNFALDVSRGMEYLHQNNIIHRDLKTANLLMDTDNVIKVADFGIARFQVPGGVMTAETGTYRWMAPEVMNHEAYDVKADVFSFGIVLWELVTAKVPYDSMTPLQAAIGVRRGLRPDPPDNANPGLVQLMKRCWEEAPSMRPSFSEITSELENLLREVQSTI